MAHRIRHPWRMLTDYYERNHLSRSTEKWTGKLAFPSLEICLKSGKRWFLIRSSSFVMFNNNKMINLIRYTYTYKMKRLTVDSDNVSTSAMSTRIKPVLVMVIRYQERNGPGRSWKLHWWALRGSFVGFSMSTNSLCSPFL